MTKPWLDPPHELIVTAVERRSSLAYVRAVLDCHARDEVVLPLDPGASAASDGVRIAKFVQCPPGGCWFTDAVEPRIDLSAAQISMSSGTTGDPKMLLLSHRALGDVTGRLVDVMGLDESIREYVGVPVTYSFGFGRVRAVAAVGGRSFIPEHGFRLDEFVNLLKLGEVNALSVVPTLARLLIQQRERLAPYGHLLRWLELGSQPMSRDEKEAVRELFPNAKIVQHYGLTEASRATFLDVSTHSGDALDSVGTATGACEIRIADEGRIAIRGPHVAMGVIDAGTFEPITDDEGWLITRDLGRIENGLLYFDGRADELINVGGMKVAPEAFEERLAKQIASGVGVAVVRGSDALRGEIVVVAYQQQPDSLEQRVSAAVAVVAGEMGLGDGVALFPVAEIPTTGSGKVRRAQLSAMFASHMEQCAQTNEPSERSDADGIHQTFLSEFGDRARDTDASFASLDGDSLQYVSVMISLERFLPELPDGWETMSIAALAALARGEPAGSDERQRDEELVDPEQLSASQITDRFIPRNLDSVRALACILIVALHVVGVTSADGLRIPAGSAWHKVMDVLDLVRMPLFAALAGFLYAAMPARRGGFGTFLLRKARQLLVPLLFVTFALWTLRGIAYGFKDNLLSAYLFGYRHLWYLYALMTIFVVVGWLESRFRIRVALWWTIAGVIACTYWAMADIRLLQVHNTVFLVPFFLFGRILHAKPKILTNGAVAVAAAIALAAAVVAQQALGAEAATWFETSLPLFVAGAASVIVFFRFLPRVRWLDQIAPYSYTIYLWHPAANATVRNGFGKLGVHQIDLLFVAGLAAGVGVPILMHKVASRLPRLISLPIIGR